MLYIAIVRVAQDDVLSITSHYIIHSEQTVAKHYDCMYMEDCILLQVQYHAL